MLRRLVSKFNVELPEGLPDHLYEPFNGDVQHVMDEREVYLYDHLCMTSLPREEMKLAIADMKSSKACVDLLHGSAPSPLWPPRFRTSW